jgi:hypothetical protein
MQTADFAQRPQAVAGVAQMPPLAESHRLSFIFRAKSQTSHNGVPSSLGDANRRLSLIFRAKSQTSPNSTKWQLKTADARIKLAKFYPTI